MITAREKFEIGDHVVASQRGLDTGLNVSTGVVTGFGRGPYVVRVLKNGLKHAISFHMDFLDVKDKTAA